MPKPSHRPLIAFGSFTSMDSARASEHKVPGARHYAVKAGPGRFALKPKPTR